MQLYQLRPIRPDAAQWRGSLYTGQCFINTADEAQARAIATRCFAPFRAWSPWQDAALAECRAVRALDRVPPDPDVVMVPSRTAFGGWLAVPVPSARREQKLRRSA